MNQIKKQVINVRLEKLRDYVKQLESYKNLDYIEFCEDPDKHYAVERVLELAIQVVLDIGSHILSAGFNESFSEYKEVMRKLGEKKVIDKTLSANLVKAAGFRNILIHDYLTIDLEEVYKSLKDDVKDFEKFIKQVLSFLDSIK